MALVVLQYKACSLPYFMDEMKLYELNTILDRLNYAVRNEWEMTREIMLAEYQCHSKKQLKAKDVMKFGWENGQTNSITKEIQKKMIDKAEQRKKILFSKLITAEENTDANANG